MSTISNTLEETRFTPLELERLLAAARPDPEVDRRTAPRHPLFVAATLRSCEPDGRVISAFTRDVSADGVGLLHAGPIRPGDVYEVELRVGDVRFGKIVHVEWCLSAGDGWFLSGGRFV